MTALHTGDPCPDSVPCQPGARIRIGDNCVSKPVIGYAIGDNAGPARASSLKTSRWLRPPPVISTPPWPSSLPVRPEYRRSSPPASPPKSAGGAESVFAANRVDPGLARKARISAQTRRTWRRKAISKGKSSRVPAGAPQAQSSPWSSMQPLPRNQLGLKAAEGRVCAPTK